MGGRAAILMSLVLVAAPVLATPDLRKQIEAGQLHLFADDSRSKLYYYLPGEIRVATDEEGKPDLRLFEVRYVGTAAAGDQGEFMFRSLFSFRVVMDGPSPQEIEDAKRAITAGKRRSVELRPLPIDRLETALVYTPVVPEGGAAEEQALPEGHFEADEEAGKSSRRSYWTERIYSVPLDIHSAQLLGNALAEGQVAVSLGYAFFAFGISPDEPLEQLSGSPTLVGAIRERLEERDAEATSHLVRAGAISVTADAARWPQLLRRVDINEGIPPAYALLDIYCYDFRENLRADLHLKRVQIEAEGVAGDPVSREVVFERSAPDLYAHSLRFPFAVRLDRPYRHRVIEVMTDGRVMEGNWVEVESWARPLDVTSTPQGEGNETD